MIQFNYLINLKNYIKIMKTYLLKKLFHEYFFEYICELSNKI